MKKLLAVVVAAALSACGGEAATEAPAQQEEAVALTGTSLPSGADLSQAPAGEIDFGVEYDYSNGEPKVRDWTEIARGPLYAGAKVTLRTVAQRFPTCGMAGAVSAGVKLDDGTVLEASLDQGEAEYMRWGELTLPATAQSAEIWLKTQNGDCVEYDSDYGKNYRFEVSRWAPTVVRFRGDWTEQADGQLQKGGALVVDYDISRLPRCRVNYRGYPTWYVKAWARFDDGSLYERNVVEFEYVQGVPNTEPESVLAVFPIPRAAGSVELWFENDQYPPTCHDWDSDFGANYRFQIQ